MKFVFEGESRKFLFKTYGSNNLALFACEMVEKRLKYLLFEFESFKRKPVERKNLLESSVCDAKILKSPVAVQRSALIRNVCSGRVGSVEDYVVNQLFQHLAGDTDTSGFSIKLLDGKFCAAFVGGKHKVEKQFDCFNSAFDWLRSMSLAEKARLKSFISKEDISIIYFLFQDL